MPVRFEICGLLLALSATCNVPVLGPVAVGMNTTLMVQLVLGARLAPQVVVETLKSPVVEITMLLSVTLWLFFSVNVFGRLAVPTVCGAYVALPGVNATGGMPVPESGTVCGLFAALSVSVMLPVRNPSWVGVNVTLIMQLAPAASVLPQGFVLVAAAKSPLITMLLMFRVELPVFATVTLLAVVFVPTTVLANTSDVGVRVTTGPLAVTVRVIVVVGFKLPDVPVIVTVDVPVAAVVLAVSVKVWWKLSDSGRTPPSRRSGDRRRTT